jgi:hypothetical protein
MAKESDNLLKKQKKFFMLIGASLYESQGIEYKLKKLSKFIPISVEDTFSKIEKKEFLERETILNKKTLDQIFNEFKKRPILFNSDAEFFVNKFIEERNTVVHHLFKIPGFNINTEEGIDKGIELLEQYRETIQDINDIFDPILIYAHIILAENIKVIEDLNKYQASLEHLYSLLNESLERAGGSLEIKPENYGFKKILEIIQISNLFELKKDKHTVYFRYREEPQETH